MRRPRKALCVLLAYREFESLPLRLRRSTSVVVIGYKTRAVPDHEHALPRRIGTHHLGPAGAVSTQPSDSDRAAWEPFCEVPQSV